MATRNVRRARIDWKHLDGLRDTDIRKAVNSDPDAAPIASSEWFQRAKILAPQPKMPVSIRLDEDVVKWFKARGRGYQTRINAVLRAYLEAHTPTKAGRRPSRP